MKLYGVVFLELPSHDPIYLYLPNNFQAIQSNSFMPDSKDHTKRMCGQLFFFCMMVSNKEY